MTSVRQANSRKSGPGRKHGAGPGRKLTKLQRGMLRYAHVLSGYYAELNLKRMSAKVAA